jgi:hypothetical protein
VLDIGGEIAWESVGVGGGKIHVLCTRWGVERIERVLSSC